jgi:phage gpG-like protein
MAKEEVKKISVEELQKRLEQLEKEKADMQAKLVEGEEAALRRVAKAMKVDADEILEREKKPVDQLVEVDLGRHRVNINGQVYTGQMTVSRSTAQVLQQAVGDKRMRLLREKFGKDHLVEEVVGMGLRSRVIGQVNEYGEQV